MPRSFLNVQELSLFCAHISFGNKAVAATTAAKLTVSGDDSSSWSSLVASLPHAGLLIQLIDRCNLPVSLHVGAAGTDTFDIVYANHALRNAAKTDLSGLAANEAITLPKVGATADEKFPTALRTKEPIAPGFCEDLADILIAPLTETAEGQTVYARLVDHVCAGTLEAESDSEGLSEVALLDASRSLAASIEQMLLTTTEADEGSSLYQAALNDFSNMLDGQADIHSFTAAVNRISEHTINLAAEFQKTRQKLAESSRRIEELRNTLHDAQRQGLIDQLTTVGNRRMFDIEASHAIAEAELTGQKFSLLLADIDHFKKFNDDHGHQTGDMILRMVGRSLSTKVRQTDVVARYGGEEFAIILPDTPIAQARTVAEKVRVDVAQRRFRKRISGENLGGVTISIGIAEWSRGKELELIIEQADRALYAAKRAGRNRIATSTE